MSDRIAEALEVKFCSRIRGTKKLYHLDWGFDREFSLILVVNDNREVVLIAIEVVEAGISIASLKGVSEPQSRLIVCGRSGLQ